MEPTDVINKITNTLRQEQSKFVEETIRKYCTWWQKLYVHMAVKFSWRIRFVAAVHEADEGQKIAKFLADKTFLTEAPDVCDIKFGVKVNGITYIRNFKLVLK